MSNTDTTATAQSGTPKSTVEIDGKEIDYTTLPASSIVALLQRGINHVLGNEVASKVSTAKKAVKGGEGADKDELKYDEAGLEKLHDETFSAKVAAIMNGTLGVRAPGTTRLSLMEKAIREVAWLIIENSPNVKSGKVKLPSGKGSGEARKTMIDNLLANDKLRAIAEEKAKARIAEEAAMGELLNG